VPVQVFGREVTHSIAVQVPAMLTGSSVLAWGPLRSRIPFQPRRTRISLVALHALQAGRAIGPRRPLVALSAMAIVHRAAAVPVQVFGREVTHSIAVQVPAMLPRSPVLARGPLRPRVPFRPRRPRRPWISLGALQARRTVGSWRTLRALRAMAIVHRAGA